MSENWRNWRNELDDIESMTDEQVTLELARQGVSPVDLERGLERCMAMLDRHKRHHTASLNCPTWTDWAECRCDAEAA